MVKSVYTKPVGEDIRGLKNSTWLRQLSPYFYILPAGFLFCLIYLYPLTEAIRFSFSKATLLGFVSYVGFDNYLGLLTPEFGSTLARTGILVIVCVPGIIILSLIGALLLNQDLKLRGLLRALVLVPWLIPENLVGVIWGWFLHPWYGIANGLLLRLRLLSTPIDFLSPSNAMLSVIMMRIWRGTPFATVAILGALQSVPQELFEAAELDGAGPLQKLLFVTIPSIRPILSAVTLIMVTWTVIIFDMIYALTGGGPLNVTSVLSIAIYKKAFLSNDLGTASAMAVIGLIILLIVNYAYFKLERREAS